MGQECENCGRPFSEHLVFNEQPVPADAEFYTADGHEWEGVVCPTD